VSGIGPTAYSAAQTQAWLDFAGTSQFARYILDVATYVAELRGEPAGFCGIGRNGHVASLYVRATHSRRGIGSTLLCWAVASGPIASQAELHAEASEFSLPLFLKLGFSRITTEHVAHGSVQFARHLVRARREAVLKCCMRCGRPQDERPAAVADEN
jgi:putative acetyltransferase